MSVILYARVSTGEQAEKDLSIPAQLRALRRLADERGWPVLAEFQDVGTGKTVKERPGLVEAMWVARTNKAVEALLVHKVDRLARNTFQYLTLKTRLRQCGVKVVSYVEHFESNPMGEFLEHVMAAQAEFYSANLGLEVKKGMEERLRRGRWCGMAPVGYLNRNGRVVVDPARGPLVRQGFELWATGQYTSVALADEMHRRGLVNRTGGKVRACVWCQILKKPFYAGVMSFGGAEYLGAHPPLVPKDLLARCADVFRLKNSGGRPRRKLQFLLAGKLECPRCGTKMTGEEVRKPSGAVHRYYRCRGGCRFGLRAADVEARAREAVRALDLPGTVGARLRENIIEANRRTQGARADRLRELRRERQRLDDQFRETAACLLHGTLSVDGFDAAREELHQAGRVVTQEIARSERGGPDLAPERERLTLVERLPALLGTGGHEELSTFNALVARVRLVGDIFQVNPAD